jgi:hypothetical protein
VNTDVRELTEAELYENQELGEDMDRLSPKEYMRVLKAVKGSMGSGNVFNGSTRFINAMLYVLCGLITAGICGEVVLYGQAQALARTVDLIVAGRLK